LKGWNDSLKFSGISNSAIPILHQQKRLAKHINLEKLLLSLANIDGINNLLDDFSSTQPKYNRARHS
jgi:hypothetical protein